MLLIEQAIVSFYDQTPANKIWLGLSGGLDSMVLLHLLARFKPKHKTLHAIHVHHGLQEQADSWVIHCQSFCERLDVPLDVKQIKLEGVRNLEAQARQARYQVFESLLGQDEVLCLAHHQRDQVETFFLNLLRGAGLEGLTAMPSKRRLSDKHQAWLFRPILHISHALIYEYALSNNLAWVEDPSNLDTRLKRNFIRHRLLPIFDQAWSKPLQRISTAIAHLTEAENLLAELAQQDLLNIEHDRFKINFKQLQPLSLARQKNAIRYWARLYHQLSLDQSTLRWIFEECITAAQDRKPKRQLRGFQLRRFRDCIYYLSDFEEQIEKTICSPCDWAQVGIKPLTTLGQGVANHWFENSQIKVIRFERLENLAKHSIKNWFQSQSIPPWERANWPVIEINGEPAALVGGYVFKKYRAQADEKALNFERIN